MTRDRVTLIEIVRFDPYLKQAENKPLHRFYIVVYFTEQDRLAAERYARVGEAGACLTHLRRQLVRWFTWMLIQRG